MVRRAKFCGDMFGVVMLFTKDRKILGGSLRERGCCLQACAQANDTYVFIYVSSLGASGL